MKIGIWSCNIYLFFNVALVVLWHSYLTSWFGCSLMRLLKLSGCSLCEWKIFSFIICRQSKVSCTQIGSLDHQSEVCKNWMVDKRCWPVFLIYKGSSVSPFCKPVFGFDNQLVWYFFYLWPSYSLFENSSWDITQNGGWCIIGSQHWSHAGLSGYMCVDTWMRSFHF